MTQFTTENLMTLLENIKNDIANQKMSIDDQKDVWNFLRSEWDQEDPVNQEMLKNLFTGWYINEMLKGQVNNDPSSPML